jgi:hypothetical protein
VKGPTPRRLKQYVSKCLRLKSYLRAPGDGRAAGRIPAAPLRWGLFMGVGLRRGAFAAIEALSCTPRPGAVRHRQYQADGTMHEAYWLTDFPRRRVSSGAILRLAKSRWEIENQGFNDAKNRYGFEPICHHQCNSLLVVWLLTCLALTVERLYRVRSLHRGTHPVRAAINLLLLLQLSLARPLPATPDSS